MKSIILQLNSQGKLKVMESSEKFQEILFSDVDAILMWCEYSVVWNQKQPLFLVQYYFLIWWKYFFHLVEVTLWIVEWYLFWIKYIVNSFRYNINCFFVLQINLFVVTSRASNSILPSYIFFMNPDILSSYLHLF